MSDVISNRQTFRLDEDFIEPFKSKRPDMSVPAYVVYLRTYAEEIDGRMAEWWETCRRVIEGAFSFLKWHEVTHGPALDWEWLTLVAKNMFQRMFEMKWIPSGRGLQHMGRDVVWVKGGAVLNSCAFVSTRYIEDNFDDAFDFLMDMSMLGVGVGFDTDGAGTVKIQPPLISGNFEVEDTREGWLALKRRILNAFVGKGTLPAFIDFRSVRPEGTPLKTMGGYASGPGPLIRLVWDLMEVLAPSGWGYHIVELDDTLSVSCERAWTDEDRAFEAYAISSLDIGDVMNSEGKCVVSGGIRRSAEIGLSKVDDVAFRHGKSRKVGLSDAWIDSHTVRYGFSPETRNDAFRWAANNSHILDEEITEAQAREIAACVGTYGDPGLFNRAKARKYGRLIDGPDNADFLVEGCNPCGEQPLEDRELCNLVETVPYRHTDIDDFIETANCALLYGKIVSLIPTHRADTNAIIQRNRRIGVSQTGVFRAIKKLGLAAYIKWCDETYKSMRAYDKLLSRLFDVNESVRITSLKPAGTGSKVLDVESGLRAPEAEYHILRIQFDNTSKLIEPLRRAGYPVLQSVQSPQAKVIEFPIYTGSKRTVADISAETQLSLIEVVQTYWSDNMVSNTVQFKESEKSQLPDLILRYGNRLKSLSFLCYDGHQYEQAPYEAISKEEYDRRNSILLPVDFHELGAYSVHDQDDKFCSGAACEVRLG